jgi:flavin prenyltransferase
MKTPRGAVEGQPKCMIRALIVGISGASGIIYGVRALQLLRGLGITTHLVMSKSAEVTLA